MPTHPNKKEKTRAKPAGGSSMISSDQFKKLSKLKDPSRKSMPKIRAKMISSDEFKKGLKK